MPPVWHVTSGPAAIYWGPDMEAFGVFGMRVNHALNLHVSRLETAAPGGEEMETEETEMEEEDEED